jgi:hypothetical protein
MQCLGSYSKAKRTGKKINKPQRHEQPAERLKTGSKYIHVRTQATAKPLANVRILGIIRTRETGRTGMIVQRFPRNPEAHSAKHGTNDESKEIQECKADLLPVGEPHTLVHVEPENAGQTVGEPACEEGCDETEQVAEDRDRLGDDPSYNPEDASDGDPGADGNEIALVHAVGTTEDTQVDVF